jgi:hypothetical protein
MRIWRVDGAYFLFPILWFLEEGGPNNLDFDPRSVKSGKEIVPLRNGTRVLSKFLI